MHTQRIPLVGISPSCRPDARLAVALARAGAIGVVDLGLDRERGLASLDRALEHTGGGLGALIRAELELDPAALDEPPPFALGVRFALPPKSNSY